MKTEYMLKLSTPNLGLTPRTWLHGTKKYPKKVAKNASKFMF